MLIQINIDRICNHKFAPGTKCPTVNSSYVDQTAKNTNFFYVDKVSEISRKYANDFFDHVPT